MATFNTLELGGMTPDLVYQNLQQHGVSQTDASLLVSGWIYQNFGNVQRTFAYAVPFPAADANCIATFARSFHHLDWVDGENVVQAQQTTGEDGFNLRFHRLEADIDGLAAEIAKLYACVAEMRASMHDRLEELRTEINRIDGDIYQSSGQKSTGIPPGRFGGLLESPNFIASTKLGAADVTLWNTDRGILALPAMVPLAGDPVQDVRVKDAADFGRFVAEHAEVGGFFTAGQPQTKAEFVRKFGTLTTAGGKTVEQLLSAIPDSSTFASPAQLSDALAAERAATIKASAANLPGVMGVALGVTTAGAAAAKIDTLSTLSRETKTALSAAGIDTVGKLAAANTTELSAALRSVPNVSAGDVGAILLTARTITLLGQ